MIFDRKRRTASLQFDDAMLELIPDTMEQKGTAYFLTRSGVRFCLKVEMIGDLAMYCALSLENLTDENSPRIQNVNSFDCTFDSEESPTLTSVTGDNCLDHGQMSYRTKLPAGTVYTAEPTGGRSSNTTAFPYFNITDECRSRVFAIGWSGQWRASVFSEKDSYRVTVGINNCDFYLKPHESVIFPSMLIYEGADLDSSRNGFRQCVIRHFSPKRSVEELHPISLAIGSCFNDAENTQSYLLDQVASTWDYGFDVIWADAIWFKGKWDRGVGNYEYKDILPNGMRPISDLAHTQNQRYLQWFEIERAFPETEMYQNHRNKLLRCYTRTEFDLVDFGNPETWKLVFDKVCEQIETQKIDIFRQDANIDPLLYWEYNDEKDRIGIKQLHYIEGLYRFWDALLERFPHLVIDNCASGGRRLDFEAMKRSVSFCSSDYPNKGLRGKQIQYNTMHLANLSRYIPNVSCISNGVPDAYYFRAGYNGAICLGTHPFIEEAYKEKAKLLIREAKHLRPYYYGDLYLLTETEAEFFVYQYALEDHGMVMCLRHEGSEEQTAQISLRGISEHGKYRLILTDEDLHSTEQTVDGKKLTELAVTLDQPQTSLVIEYQMLS